VVNANKCVEQVGKLLQLNLWSCSKAKEGLLHFEQNLWKLVAGSVKPKLHYFDLFIRLLVRRQWSPV